MYINELKISNFRNIKSLNLIFNKGLNVFIGENNSGKTSVIDALRICLGWGDQDKNIFVRTEDLYVDKTDNTLEKMPIQFDLMFKIEEDLEGSTFYDLLSNEGDRTMLRVHYKFWFENKGERTLFRSSVWGGDNEGQTISPETFDMVRHVYMGALRDVSKDMQMSKGNKLGNLMEKIVTDKSERDRLAKKVDSLLHEDADWKTLRQNAKDEINKHLKESSISGKEIMIDLRFLDTEFRKVVGDLRIKVPMYSNIAIDDPNQGWFQVNQNGLGDNNRIYIASVLGDLLGLKNLEQETYIALLIEEPEAHLHPQLQNILFTYFGVLADKIQVFITSHSPTITAKTDINTLTVFRSNSNNIDKLSLRDSALDEEDKLHLHKFLDVTKAQLFFAGGVLLVEGISEALLLPVFAKLMGKATGDENKFDLTKFGIEIVNVGGVSFKSFARLFNSDNADKRLSNKCSIITDSDPSEDGTSLRSQRAENALGLESGLLKVKLATSTFEKDLYDLSTRNSTLLKNLYAEMHPSTQINNSNDLIKALKNNKDKGEFAQKLSMKLSTDNVPIDVPQYIQEAIKWVIEQ